MRAPVVIVSCAVLLSGCPGKQANHGTARAPSAEPHIQSVTPLTFDGDNGEAYFTWDDRQLIFQSNRGGQECDKIWIMNVDGSGKRMVSSAHGAHTCAFAFPDNERIVFASTSHLAGDCPPKRPPPPGQRYVWPLHSYDIFAADGTTTTRITDNPGYDAEAIVSSDGQRIVFGSQRDGDFDIYVMNADGSQVRRLTERIGYDGGPWFSPDDQQIVWRAWYPETDEEHALWRDCMTHNYIVPFPLDIWLMDATGANKRRLVHNGATNWAPSWHPDGQRIIFSSNMDDWRQELQQYGHNFELYLINADGTGLMRLTHNDVFDSFPMFSHDGRMLAFASNRNPARPRATDIFIADWIE